MNKKISSNIIALSFGVLVLLFVIGFYAFASWTPPEYVPPLGNVPEPLNVGPVGQNKEGGLMLNTGGAGTGLIVATGTVGIGTTAPVHKLQVGIPGAPLEGTVGAEAFFHISDITLKTNVQTIQDSLEKILKLQGVYFDWLGSDESSIGLIAQDIEKVFPEVVSTDSQGLKWVDYGKLVAPLIQAISEQQEQIDEQQAMIEELRTEIENLK